MLSSICLIAYFSSRGKPSSTTMAKQNEFLETKRYQNFLCAPQFKSEIENFNKQCAPVKCGRAVMDDLVSSDQIHKLLNIAKKGFSVGQSTGGASILDLHSGALSKEDKFINVYKTNPELFTENDFKIYREVKNIVKAAVASHFKIDESTLYLSHPTFFFQNHQ